MDILRLLFFTLEVDSDFRNLKTYPNFLYYQLHCSGENNFCQNQEGLNFYL